MKEIEQRIKEVKANARKKSPFDFLAEEEKDALALNYLRGDLNINQVSTIIYKGNSRAGVYIFLAKHLKELYQKNMLIINQEKHAYKNNTESEEKN